MSPRIVDLAKNSLNDISRMLGERQIADGVQIGLSKNLARNAASATATDGVIHQFTSDHKFTKHDREKMEKTKMEKALRDE